MSDQAAFANSSAIDRTQPPFILVDGSYYLFRSFHALPALATSQGQLTNAIKGTYNALNKLIRRFNPTHMAVVFDTPEPTFRHELSPIYKAHRPPMPSELSSQIPYVHALVEAMGLPLLKLAGAEADDIIGTLTKRACAEGHHVLISTGDKDMAQLVNDCVLLEDSFKEQVLDEAGVMEKFGVRPDQIVDYLALMGDTSDGIPGIPSVGAKTAAKLLAEYGSIATLGQHLDQIKGKLGENLRQHWSDMPLNHQLATIICDLPLVTDWHELKIREPDVEALRRLYTELEFAGALSALNHPNNPHTSATPLPDSEHPAPLPPPRFKPGSASNRAIPEIPRPAIPAKPQMVQYHTVLSETDFQALKQRLAQAPHFVFDTETTSLDYRKAQIVGLAFSLQIGEAFYIPLAHDPFAVTEPQLDRERVLAELKPLFEDPHIGKIGQHLKYDAHVLENHGIHLAGWQFDTMLASYVLNPTATRHNMDDLAQFYLDYQTITFESVAGKGAKQLTFDQIPLEKAAPYACEDADITYRLYSLFDAELKAQPALLNLFQTVEMPTAPVLQRMERDGIKLDTAFLATLGSRFGEEMAKIEQTAYDQAGQAFNIASPKQLGEMLFDKLGIAGGKKTASGQYATGEAVLEKIDHPLAQTVLEHRGLAKLKSTYTDRLIDQADAGSKRVHTSYHQAVTATGRLSSSDPNLQNIPIRGETGRLIRQAFIAPEGRILLAADYSQIELRLMAHLSQDPTLIHAFQHDLDIHTATAAEVLGIELADVTSDQRREAKTINFGLIYGMSAFGLAKQLNLPRNEAQSYIEQYFARYPGVKAYMSDTRKQAHELGYVETILGRRLYTPDLFSPVAGIRSAAERAAINAPLQGSAADIIKLAMVALHDQLMDAGWRQDAKMLLQVHDELVFEVDEDRADELAQLLEQVMPHVIQLSVPLGVEVGRGQNWDQAH